MSTRQPPRWIQIVLISGLVMAGLALVIIPQIEIPHPWIYDPDESAERILRADQSRRWVVTHAYGALSAENIELQEIRERGDALPEGLRTTYYDGAAHHQQVDFDALDAWLMEIKNHIPASRIRFFHDGIMRLYVKENATNPKQVLAFATDLSNKTGTPDLSNGIRIGIQQAFGDNMREAIQVALKYPADLYFPLLEELGWRVGNDHGVDPKHWREHANVLPDKTSCWFAEGMVRGATILMIQHREIWWSNVLNFRSELPESCGPEIASGIAEALLIVLGDNPDSIEKELEQIESMEDREMVTNILNTKQGDVEQKLDALPNAYPDLPPMEGEDQGYK